MQGLLPTEKVTEQANSQHRQKDGVIIITNMRLLWRQVGD